MSDSNNNSKIPLLTCVFELFGLNIGQYTDNPVWGLFVTFLNPRQENIALK
jgi:hypothetical protein